MPSLSQRRSAAATDPITQRNDRAVRILRGPRGEPCVFGASLSADGVSALCKAASELAGSVGRPWALPPYEGIVSAPSPSYPPAIRLHQLAAIFVSMRRARVDPADRGWNLASSRIQSRVIRGLPTRVPPDTEGRRADTVVAHALADASALDGLTALTVVVETAALPEPVMLNLHPHPLIPATLAVGLPARVRGGVVSPVVPDAYASVGWLPLLGKRSLDAPVLPLPLYSLLTDRADGKRGGHCADLALRIFIESVTAVMQRDWRRAVQQVVGITLPWREFLSWFYKSRRSRPHEYWPWFLAASEALDRADARFPCDNGDGRGSLRRVVSLGEIPRGAGHLDDNVTLSVWLPPGSADGPAINRMRLRYWGRTSEVAYRALLGLAYYWYQPGKTRIPTSRGGWIQSRDPERYTPFSDDGLIALCFPTSKMQRRSVLRERALRCLRRLHLAGDVVLDGRRVLPPLDSL